MIPGRDRARAPLVVTTPRSGWWQCAGERGGGIACWLEVMRAVVASAPARDVLFCAFSGHELGFLGATMLLERRPELARQAYAWLHFGANIGAAVQPGVRFSGADDTLRELASAALTRAGVTEAVAAPHGTIVGGESNVVAEHGARTIGLVGGNALFHLETDRYPRAVDVGAVARQAAAFSEVALTLAHD